MATNKNTETLPIETFHNDIMGCDSPYVVVEAETGSGKSTMVPQWYHSLGMRVLVTEPFIETVIGTSEYVAGLMGCQLGSTVGYRTGSDRCDSPKSDILFCTDGLALVRELSGHNRFDVLVIDELHEWNTNQSTLEAWAWKHLQAGDSPFKKIVVLSATLASDELSAKRGNAPVFKVPGRQFRIVDKAAGSSMISDVKDLVAEGYDVLVFQPGKKEIEDTITGLNGINAELIPFHGQLERAEKNKAYKSYSRPKVVVSTNALETGRTLMPSPGRKLAVVDSGLEKRVEQDSDGIEGLYLKPIAKAKGMQRRGRTGRVGEGIYIDHCPSTGRPAYPVPEILRTRLDQTVLRLACHGYDATKLPFFHELDMNVIAEAKRALQALGAMREDGAVTKTGRLMSRLPVSVGQARMILEADKRGVVDDVITIAAILNVKGIRDRTGAWRDYTAETRSDVLAELDLWQAARGKRNSELRDMGIFAKDYNSARQTRRKLMDVLRQHRVKLGSSGDREEILKSVCAGMVDHLYKFSYSNRMGSWYVNGGSSEARLLGRQSSVVRSGPEWLVGIGFNAPTRRGGILPLVTQVTAVDDPTWLTEVAPQLASEKTGLNPRYDAEQDVVVSTTQTFFNGQMVREQTVVDGEHPEAAKVFARWLSSQSGLPTVPGYSAGQTLETTLRSNAARQERARQLNIRTGSTFQVFSSDEMFERFTAALSGARRILEVVRPEALALPTLDEDKVAEVLSNQPDTIDVLGSNLVVEYRTPSYDTVYAPCVKLSDEHVSSNRWLELPDEGVRLPGGRLVEVVVSFGYYTTISDTNISQLKAKVREHLNREQWDRWTKPEIEIPDLSADDAVIPFITLSYGTCMVTGDDLKAYGTLQASRYWSSDPITWKPVWYRDIVEAENAANTAAQEFVKNLVEAKVAKEHEEAEAEAKTAREELKGLQSDNGWYDLDYELRRKAEDRRTGCYSRLPSTVEEVRAWTVETKAIIAEVQTAMSELLRKREEAKDEEIEEEELTVILKEIGEDYLNQSREIKAFAEDVGQIRGTCEGSKILRGELEAPYGRARRQDAILWKVPGIDSTDMGSRFLCFGRARDVDAWLAGAVAWLESKLEKKSKGNGKVKHQQPVQPGRTLDSSELVDGLAALKAKFGGGR